MISETRLVQVRTKILKDNDIVARRLRQRFNDHRVFVVSFVSSPGAGKTALLERILTNMRERFRVAALVGDLATDNDAQRLARSGAPIKQITTGTMCHLEAEMIERSLVDWNLDEIDFLFLENVGNLVCPSTYDLGEHCRFVLMSVTEGEDKPRKYPTIFNTADATIITKIDLAPAVEFDEPAALESIFAVRPGMKVFSVSAKTGRGLEQLAQFIENAAHAWWTASAVHLAVSQHANKGAYASATKACRSQFAGAL